MVVPVAEPKSWTAAREAAVWADLSDRQVLRITGSERAEFLHGMCTNDITGLAVGASNYAAFLTPKGSMVCDARVLKRADDLVLDTGPGQLATLRAFLEKYLISEDAELIDAPELAVVGLIGPKAKEALERIPQELVLGQFLSSFAHGVDVLVAREHLSKVTDSLAGIGKVDAATLEVLRVEAGVPRFGADLTETTIPLEANLDRAISLNKGCYVGQEVIARATYRGHMNRKLSGLLLGTLTPEVGTELQVAGKKVGWVTSVVASQALGQNVALAYVHRDANTPGTAVDVQGGGTATVAALPLA
jgi:folate-binding protein YgfZ